MRKGEGDLEGSECDFFFFLTLSQEEFLCRVRCRYY
jgi:hypothetical protein